MLSISKPLRGRRSLPVESVSVAGELSELSNSYTAERVRKMAAVSQIVLMSE